MEKQFQNEISVIFPCRNEGEKVASVLDELIAELEKIGRSYEIIAINSPAKESSYPTLKSYADKYKNFTAVELSDRNAAGSGKTIQYMIGYQLATGRYIIQIDSDGQDFPGDLPKFVEKLDEGYDLVVGYKQRRKDGRIYMLTSKISNFLTRWITGVEIHDMNCGFKAFQSYAAKRLNLTGRLYRYIPAILGARGYRITEVPIMNRKREWGKTNFSFFNRLQGGLFDLILVIMLNKMGDTPVYFWGWIALGLGVLFIMLLGLSLLTADLATKIGLMIFSASSLLLSFTVFFNTLRVEFTSSKSKRSLDELNIREIYRKTS